MTVREAALRLGVSARTAYRLIQSGELRVVDMGRNGRQRLRVRQDDLDALIASRTHDPIDPVTVLDRPSSSAAKN